MDNSVNYDDIVNKDIFELMGAKDMPEEKRRDLYTKILETIQNRVVTRIADNLNDKDTADWLEIKKTADKKQMNDFLAARGIDINKLMTQETLMYKMELVQLSEPLRKAGNDKKEQNA